MYEDPATYEELSRPQRVNLRASHPNCSGAWVDIPACCGWDSRAPVQGPGQDERKPGNL